jgi:hypothetical protein
MNKHWMKKYKKVIYELIEYINWYDNTIGCDITNKMEIQKIKPPLIWDIYYEYYNYDVKLSDVFKRDISNIIKNDFQVIYKYYLPSDYYNNKIKPYIKEYNISTDIKNNMIINKKYELVLLLDIIHPIKHIILSYLIC